MFATLIIFVFLSSNPIASTQFFCLKTDAKGPQKNVPCIFPFTFDEIVYNDCTQVADPDGLFWCSTKVDLNGVHNAEEDSWGYCHTNCDQLSINEIDDSPNEVSRARQKRSSDKESIKSSSNQNSSSTLNPFAMAFLLDTNSTDIFFNQTSTRPTTVEDGVSLSVSFLVDSTTKGYNDQRTTKTSYDAPPIREASLQSTSLSNQAFTPSSSINNANSIAINGTYIPNPVLMECGLQNKLNTTGSNRDLEHLNSYSFIAALGFEDRLGNISQECEGVLINNRYVLTAAHCQSSDRPITHVLLGIQNFTNDRDCENCSHIQSFEIKPENVILHEGYIPRDDDISENDIALIRLPREVITFREDPDFNVFPICLPNNKTNVVKGENFVLGWKTTYNSTSNERTRSHTQKVSEFSEEICKENFFKKVNVEKHICTETEKGNGDCSKYSGSSLISVHGNDSQVFLRGITSSDSRLCDNGTPEVFSNIQFYVDWIEDNLRP